ncbi:hypothetical protein Efla_000196 [Eimeria flavescens]
MAMHECEAYWQDFLRRPKEQRAIREEHRRLQKEAADRLAALKVAKLKEVEDALARCTPDQQRLLRPLLKAPGVLENLHDCLLRSDRDSSVFSRRIETEQPLASMILEKAAEYERDPEAFERLEQRTNELHEEAARPVDMADLDYLKKRTWKDLPSSELAERMSKGEICPREEWIPGISKGKRPLDTAALEEHLSFGERLAREGREAYAARDYDTAFMRFRQGEELVNWVEARDAVRQRSVDDMYCMFLRNVAQSALKLEKYQEAIRASTTIIQQLDEHDSKARYRRGRAYLLLGMAKCAKDDFLFILKSPYSTNEAVHAARLGLEDLRRVVSRSETEAKTTVRKGLSGGLFSRGRLTEEEAIRATFSADTNADEENFGEPEDDLGFRLPPLQKFRGSASSLVSMSEEDASLPYFPTSGETKGVASYQLNRAQGSSANSEDAERPPLNLDETRNLLLDLLDAYTSEPVASQLNELRSLADFDYRRVVLRARKFLPQIQAPILSRHGLQGESHRSQMKVLEKSVAFWRFQDPEIAELTRDCLDAIFGDVADIDV